MNLRNIFIGLFVVSVLAGIVAACGGGGYGGSTAAPTYTVGGNITGASGTVTLKLNGGNDNTMGNGAFTFTTMLANGATYNVQVIDANDRCTVTGGAGTMGAANIANVAVICGAQGANKVIRTTVLSGAQEVPATAATGTGVGGVIVDPVDNSITGGITFSGLTGSPTDVGIYLAAPGANAGASFITLVRAADNATATIPEPTILTGPQFTALLAGNLYFNIKTAANTAGEIRGQINVQGGVYAAQTNLDAAQEVLPPSTSTATGKGTLLVDQATRIILISYMTHNVVGANAGHIHSNATGPGSIGPVIVPFNNLDPNLVYPVAGTQMSTSDISNLTASYTYFNIHSPTFPLGEIRGDIGLIP